MLNNVPVKTTKHGDFTIEGYSRAAVQTYWRIPELRLGFDLGAHPWDFMGTANWLITHCHLDHIAALPLYVARRRLMDMEPPRIYLPKYAISMVRQMLQSFSALDRGRLPCELIGVEPGERFELSRELVVDALEMQHRVPCLGYVVYDRRKKLLAKYAHLTGDEIRDLRLKGETITREVLVPLVGFTGDTSPAGLDRNPILYETRILIAEMTFVADEHRLDYIHKHGHCHLDDFVERAKEFKNEKIIASHFSVRYTRAEAESWVRERLPDYLDDRLQLWI